MTYIRAVLGGLIIALFSVRPATARTIDVEFLQGTIDLKTVDNLSGLACRNYDHIVHLKIAIDWPSNKRDEEQTGYKRLVFWDKDSEYLFPSGTYLYLHGDYIINGFFIPRSGGIHQGIVSVAFEKIDDAQVLLNPNVEEIQAKGSGCK